jgi:hypothetical protein
VVNKPQITEAIVICMNSLIRTCDAIEALVLKNANPSQLLLILAGELDSAAKTCIRGCSYALYPNLRGYPDLQSKIADALRCMLADMLQELSKTLYLLRLHIAEYINTQGRLPEDVDKVIVEVNQGVQMALKRICKNAESLKEVIRL